MGEDNRGLMDYSWTCGAPTNKPTPMPTPATDCETVDTPYSSECTCVWGNAPNGPGCPGCGPAPDDYHVSVCSTDQKCDIFRGCRPLNEEAAIASAPLTKLKED